MGLISLQRPQGKLNLELNLKRNRQRRTKTLPMKLSELGTVHAEAGNGIEASDGSDVSKPQPLQIDLKQGQFVGRPALQLRNFSLIRWKCCWQRWGR